MPVTEIALLRLKEPVISESFRAVFSEALQKQYDWYCNYSPAHRQLCESVEGEDAHATPEERAQASLKRDFQARAVHYWHCVEDPHLTCIVTNWTTAEEHYVWIGSDDNKSVMGKMLEFFVEPPQGVELFHVDPALLPSVTAFPAEEIRPGSTVLTRWVVPADKRKDVEEVVAGTKLPGGSGWRIEKSNPETDELIILSTDKTAYPSPPSQLDGIVKDVKVLTFNRIV